MNNKSDNNPNADWIQNSDNPKTDENEKYERFYYKWKRRIARGENPESASKDAPPGFKRWLKSYKRMIK